MPIPHAYEESVYAGVLGKIIGVYLGRPIEGMLYRDILKTLGPISYYVHEQRKQALVVSDDDITGTFTFARALRDYPREGRNLTARHIGQTWLNYIIENKSILWWGGVGMSTEHTAFHRLKNGIDAPHSGSIASNGKVVAEQIGAQIFIDGWAMIAPGDPELAVALATRAASVSHDGEAVYAAQVIAAAEALAFVEKDIGKLLDGAIRFIPKDSVIYRLIDDLRSFHAKEPDWNRAMTELVEKRYGYDKFGGNCHVVPNHALIILALLYGDDDFQKSLMIVNTCGWDTDCNSGNVGCLLGIKNGLRAIDAQVDFRGPVADRLFLPTAEGGSCITDALAEAYKLAGVGRRLQGQAPVHPKNNARFHFSLPGSLQGFAVVKAPTSKGLVKIANENAKLEIRFDGVQAGLEASIATPTFISSAEMSLPHYSLQACPTLSTGQLIESDVAAGEANSLPVLVRVFISYYGPADEVLTEWGPEQLLAPGESAAFSWNALETHGHPIFEIGYQLSGGPGVSGNVFVDRLTWSGAPTVTLARTPKGAMTRRAWVEGVSHAYDGPDGRTIICQDDGRGLNIQGTHDWTDYTSAVVIKPHLARSCGLAIRVQGMRRYYALLLAVDQRGTGVARLVKYLENEEVLAEVPFHWPCDAITEYSLSISGKAGMLSASIDGRQLFHFLDPDPLLTGALGLIVEEGRVDFGPVRVIALRDK